MKKNKLIALALIPVLMPFTSFAQDAQPVVTDKASESIPSTNGLTDKLWLKAKTALKNAKVSKQFNLPTQELAKGLNFGASYRFESKPSEPKLINGHYSGIDIWNVNLSAYPELFGINNLPVSVGLSAQREITYIQHFKTQKESLARVPYDPITKLPLKSKMFFEKHTNIFTGETSDIFKPGDFIGYRAPMTLAIGKGLSAATAGYLGLNVGLSYVLSGEFDVHVFVMNNNFVRVKLIASKSDSKGASLGINIFGFNGLGAMIVNRLIDTNIFQLSVSKTNSDLFLADYIFNLNDTESRNLYDKFVGSKLNIFDAETVKTQLLLANPFTSHEATRERLLTELDELNALSTADITKPYSERRILKIMNSHNESEIASKGLKLNLFKIIKAEDHETKTGSKITFYAQDSSDIKGQYKLDSYASNVSFSLMNFLDKISALQFLVWGNELNTSNSLLTEINKANEPIGLIGLHNSRIKKDKFLKQKEFEGLINRLQKILPHTIYNKLEKPQWSFKKGMLREAYFNMDITFNDELFKMPVHLSEAQIRQALITVVENYGQFKSRPIGAKTTDVSQGERDYVMEAFHKGNFVEAYGNYIETKLGGEKREVIDQEMLIIPQHLAVVLNSNYAFKDRYASFNYLYSTIPLFSEISTVLILKLIPEKDLEKMVTTRLVMSADGQKTVYSEFPEAEKIITSNLFREILSQNSYITDKSYNLRYYIKETGEIYSLDEVMVNK